MGTSGQTSCGPPIDSGLVTYGDEREPSPRGVDRRNIAIIGAPDAGATTLAERMERDARDRAPSSLGAGPRHVMGD